MDPKTLLLCIYLCVGTLMVVLGVPLVRGKVPPNPWYGLRVRRTLTDPAVWYPANRYAGRWLLAAAVASTVAAAAGYFAPVGLAAYGFICAGVLLAALAAGIVQSFRFLRSIPDTAAR